MDFLKKTWNKTKDLAIRTWQVLDGWKSVIGTTMIIVGQFTDLPYFGDEILVGVGVALGGVGFVHKGVKGEIQDVVKKVVEKVRRKKKAETADAVEADATDNSHTETH